MSGSGRFGTVVTAMVTPFTSDGALDLDEAARLAKALVASGSDGLVVAGTTGEGSTLTDDEKLDLFAAVAEAVTVPVLAGSTSNDTPHSVNLSAQASTTGVAGILAVCPYYNRPSQQGIAAHFAAVADATPLPVVLYDIPARTGRRVGPATVAAIAAGSANVVAVKDASGDLTAAASSIAAHHGRLEWYSGDDSLTLAFAALGAVGVISVASHWAAEEFHALFDGAAQGDLASARAANARLFESYSFQGGDQTPNPLPAKAMMRTLGFAVGQCRLPMGPSDPDLDLAATALVTQLGLLGA